MKRKKWIYIVLLIILIVPILYLYEAFNGNPISKYIAKKELESFLTEKYPDSEYRITKDFYNFKIGGYSYDVVRIGSEGSYEFEVKGFFNPTVTYDGVYYANLDTPLIEKLSEQASAELLSVLSNKVPEITNIYVQLEVLKGERDANTDWNKDLQLEKPMYISLTLDVTNMTKDNVLHAAETIQQTLEKEDYAYDRVSLNGNMFDLEDDKDNRGYVKYALGFNENTNITLKDIEEFNQ